MPTIQCPSCKSDLNIADKHIGKKLSCKKCKAEFIAGEDAEPVPDSPAKLIGSIVASVAIIAGIAWACQGCYAVHKEIQAESAKPSYHNPHLKGREILYTCPSCGAKLKAGTSEVGVMMNCPDCGVPAPVPRPHR